MASRAALAHERPETARPPVHGSDAPPVDEMGDAFDVDIDALLPVAMGAGAERVVIGPDLAELLRAAEDRLDSRGAISQRTDAGEDVPDVPVPEDVLSLLAEPLEPDEEEAATGAHLGSASGGTGADRPATMDGQVGTAHGEEEDLEEPLPRASDPPKVTTLPPGVTGVGREEAAPPAEVSRGAVTRPGLGDEPSVRAEPPALSRTVDELPFRAEVQTPAVPMSAIGRAFGDRAPGIDRGAALIERAAMAERRFVARRSGSDLPPAPAPAPERPAASDRGQAHDRGPGRGFVERPSERGFAERPSERGLAERPSERGFVERPSERGLAERPVASDWGPPRTAERPSDRGLDRPAERAPHVDPTRWNTAKMAAISADPVDSGPKSRARTEAMPAVLGPGDAARAVGRAIANRVSGALVITSGDDQRRVVLHDGDVVTAGSSAPVESLVAFLSARGDIDRDLVPRLSGKLPAFGRHAGAALVAHGHLGQDDLWPVLRAHAEWVIGRALLVESGTCELEVDPPARYKAEPSVFGGATGAEVFVDIVQRAIAPEAAFTRLGGYGARLVPGSRTALLAECALSPDEEDAVRAAPGRTVHEFAGDGPTERWSMLYALVCLDVIDALPAVAAPPKREEPRADPLDEEALRARVRARLALVEEGDYFALLGVPRTATSYEIRRAYLELRRAFEPSRILTAATADLADDVRLVVEVVDEAYDVLRDANRRERYRRAIEGGPPPR